MFAKLFKEFVLWRKQWLTECFINICEPDLRVCHRINVRSIVINSENIESFRRMVSLFGSLSKYGQH